MVLDRLRRDEQPLADLSVRLIAEQEPGHLKLAPAEDGRRRVNVG
jgi:hypothetical protein